MQEVLWECSFHDFRPKNQPRTGFTGRGAPGSEPPMGIPPLSEKNKRKRRSRHEPELYASEMSNIECPISNDQGFVQSWRVPTTLESVQVAPWATGRIPMPRNTKVFIHFGIRFLYVYLPLRQLSQPPRSLLARGVRRVRL